MNSSEDNFFSRFSEKQILYTAIFLTAIVAYFSVGFHHFDEHFQILEFMNYKLGQTSSSELPWEFQRKMRPWFQPYLYLVLDTPLRLMNVSPFTRAFFLRIYSGAFFLFSLHFLFKNIFKDWFETPSQKKTALAVTLLTWFIPYVAVRPSAESLSISLFFLGVSFCLKQKKNFLVAGALFGLSYLCRFQMALPIAVFWFWGIIIAKWNLKDLALYAFSIVIFLCLGTALDSYSYSQFTFAIWNYFEANFLDGVLKSMGVSPWYKYLEWSLVKLIPPVSLFIIGGTVLYWKNHLKSEKSWLTWTTLSFFLFHSLIGHKEYRFIFLCAVLAPLMSYYCLRHKRISKILISLNFMIFLITLKPANKMIPLYKFIYNANIQKIFFVDENPKTLVGLPLNFYFQKNFDAIELGDLPHEGKYIFTKRFRSTKSYLEKGCKVRYLNYPKAIFKSYPEKIQKYLKKQKVMGVFYCKPKV